MSKDITNLMVLINTKNVLALCFRSKMLSLLYIIANRLITFIILNKSFDKVTFLSVILKEHLRNLTVKRCRFFF